MMDVPLPGEEPSPKKKVTLTFMQSKLLNISSSAFNDDVLEKGESGGGGEKDESGSPQNQTDDFLTIIPKPTLLGKQQAKKRLQAFGATKQLTIVKKTPEVKKEEEKKPKKSVKPEDRAKTTIEEIELIKKLEISQQKNRLFKKRSPMKDRCLFTEYFDTKVQGPLFKYGKHYSIIKDSKDHKEAKQAEYARHSKHSEKESRHHDRDSKYHDKDGKHSDRRKGDEKDRRNTEKRYPADWKEVRSRELSLEDIREIDSVVNKKSTSQPNEKPIDVITMVKFVSPNIPMVPLKYKKANGQSDIVPPQILRFTTKSSRIPYSANPSQVKNVYFSRNVLLETIPKNQKESLKSLIAQSSNQKPVLSSEPFTTRKWYPKTPFSPQCEILEPSLGLAILQSYSDEEEPEHHVLKPEPTAEEIQSEITPLKEESKKVKKKKSRSERRKEKKVRKKKKKLKRKIEKKKKKKRKEKKAEEKKPVFEVCDLNTLGAQNVDEVPTVGLIEPGTPDTEEYHSHWESDEDLISADKIKKENSWESEEEEAAFGKNEEVVAVRPAYDKIERSLEMPLNINITRSRISSYTENDSIKKSDANLECNKSNKNPELKTDSVQKHSYSVFNNKDYSKNRESLQDQVESSRSKKDSTESTKTRSDLNKIYDHSELSKNSDFSESSKRSSDSDFRRGDSSKKRHSTEVIDSGKTNKKQGENYSKSNKRDSRIEKRDSSESRSVDLKKRDSRTIDTVKQLRDSSESRSIELIKKDSSRTSKKRDSSAARTVELSEKRDSSESRTIDIFEKRESSESKSIDVLKKKRDLSESRRIDDLSRESTESRRIDHLNKDSTESIEKRDLSESKAIDLLKKRDSSESRTIDHLNRDSIGSKTTDHLNRACTESRTIDFTESRTIDVLKKSDSRTADRSKKRGSSETRTVDVLKKRESSESRTVAKSRDSSRSRTSLINIKDSSESHTIEHLRKRDASESRTHDSSDFSKKRDSSETTLESIKNRDYSKSSRVDVMKSSGDYCNEIDLPKKGECPSRKSGDYSDSTHKKHDQRNQSDSSKLDQNQVCRKEGDSRIDSIQKHRKNRNDSTGDSGRRRNDFDSDSDDQNVVNLNKDKGSSPDVRSDYKKLFDCLDKKNDVNFCDGRIDSPDFRLKKKLVARGFDKISDFSDFNSEMRELVLARQSLSEERRVLEEEKRLIEEREKRIAGMRERLDPNYDENKVIKEESIDEASFESGTIQIRSRRRRWDDSSPLSVTVKEEFAPEPAQNSLSNTSNSWEKVNLETEYEQFMRAVQSNVKEEENCPDDSLRTELIDEDKSRKRKLSVSSSSASSRSSSRSSVSAQFDNRNICLDDVPLPQPLPVPSPKGADCVVDSTSSPLKKPSDPSQIDLENRKPINSIVIAKRTKQLLDNSLFKDSDESDSEKASLNEAVKVSEEGKPKESTEHRIYSNDDKYLRKSEEKDKYSRKSEEKYDGRKHSRKSEERYLGKTEDAYSRRTTDERHSYHRSDHSRSSDDRHKSEDKIHSGDERKSISKHRKSPPRKHSRSRHSPPSRRHRAESPRKRYRDRERFSPRRSRDRSPRKSPTYRRRSRSPRNETIQVTLSRLAGLEPPRRSRSPVDSPLDGFRKSLADSTISDEQLMQNQEHYITESPRYFPNNAQFKNPESSSPKRIPLEERINRALGIEKEEPKPISTTYSQDYNNYNYYDGYGNYTEQYYEGKQFGGFTEQQKTGKGIGEVRSRDLKEVNTNVTKVVQVGNVLQVVPIEDIPVPIKNPVEKEVPQKILQVGNMLQIVPAPTITEIVPSTEVKSAEDVMKEKAAEMRAEREKRRLEREKRRKEKEKKRKEREKRRQLKIKQKSEEVIKRALLMETEGNDEEAEEIDSKQWLAVSSIVHMGNRPVGKSILVRNRSNEVSVGKQKKGVKFADGIIPGEGTSPSAGEELSSPPPMPYKGIKEKRFTKTKKPKKIKQPKKKIKVKVIKKSSSKHDDDDDDNLPPPSPPPGSPPPHLFPPRLKPIPNPTVQNFLQPIPQQQPPPAMAFPFPPGMQGTPPPSLPTFPPNMTSVPPPNLQILGQQPPSYPPPPIGLHIPPHHHHHLSHPTQGSGHQGQTGRPSLTKQPFNSSISPPQHMLGPHNG